MEISITKTTTPKQKPADESKLGFGQYYTDHMFIMNYDAVSYTHLDVYKRQIYNSLDAPLLVYMQTNYLKDGSITYVYDCLLYTSRCV